MTLAPTRQVRRWPAGVTLVVSLTLSLLASLYTLSGVERDQRRELELIAAELAAKVQTRLRAHAQVLRSGAAHFAGSERVTRQEWRTFVARSRIDLNLPGIQGIGFAQLIPAADLRDHERAVRAEGFPEYRVWPAGERAVYTAIVYLEPFSGRNRRAFGYDMFADPLRREAMTRARDLDVAALSGKVLLVQETDEDIQAGTLMYVPLYRPNMPATTAAERQAALVGWVYSPYRMDDLMASILDDWDLHETHRVRLAIYDGAGIGPERLLYDCHADEPLAEIPSAGQVRVPVDFNGKVWTLRVSRAAAFPAAVTDPKVLLVAGGGMVTSLLLAALMQALSQARWQAAQLAARTRESEFASEARSRFLRAASHDLRQPMQALGLFVAQLHDRIPDPETRRLAAQAQAAATAMQELLDAILDISRLDAGLVSPAMADFPVNHLFQRLDTAFAPTAVDKGLRWRIVPCRAWVRSDLILVERILLNLIANAIRYTERGGILVGCRRRGDQVRIAVYDTGIGIPVALQRTIFQEFYQIPHPTPDPTQDRRQGLGLGLAIASRLARLLGGHIQVTSRPGRGSRFAIDLPRGQPTVQPGPAPRLDRTTILAGALILIVDDDALVLEALRGLLEHWHCAVLTATAADAALATIEAADRLPDVILCDYQLRGETTGLELIQRLRVAAGLPIPGALLSGDTSPESLRRIRDSGLPLLSKPVAATRLRALLTHLLATASLQAPGPDPDPPPGGA
jgi:signal transduction histidine kinase